MVLFETGKHDVPVTPDRSATARLVVDAAPESFRVVAVDIPSELLAEEEIRYEVVPAGVRLLSARKGVIRPALGRRQLVFSVQVPATAEAGLAPMAEVVFMGRSRMITTSVDANIAARRRTEIASARAVYGARTGERVELSFTITNSGNAEDTLDLQVLVPADWRLEHSHERSLVLGAGASKELNVRVRLPDGLISGDAAVALVAQAHGVERARGSSTVRVVAREVVARSSGSVLATLTITDDALGAPQTGMSVNVRAAVTPTLNIDARFAARSASSGAEVTSIPLLSYLPSSNHFTLSSSRWTLQAGSAGAIATELTGQFLAGSGASLQYRSDGLRVRTMVGRPWQTDTLAATGSPLLGFASAEVSRRDGGAWIAASHIDEYRVTSRRLDALALGGWYRASAAVRVSAEVADRRYAGGHGIGFATVSSVTRPGSDLSLRVLSAPGGSGAHASGNRSADLHATHAFTQRIRVAADGWYVADSNVTARTTSGGWSITPELTLSRWLSAGLDLRGVGFQSGLASTGIVNSQNQLGLRVRSVIGAIQLGTQLTHVREQRSFSASGLTLHELSQRLLARGEATHESAWGSVRATYSYTSPGVWMPTQRSVILAVDHFRPVPSLRNITLQAAVERVMIGKASLNSFSGTATVGLSRDTRLLLGMERNDALRSVTGVSHGYTFVRVEKAFGLSFAKSPWSRSGVVFRDLNGNGVRDRDERGFPGLVMRRSGESVVSDVNGRFSLPNDNGGEVSLDERSLPSGWIVGRRPTAHSGARIEIPVAPTGRVEVTVTLRSDVGAARAVRMGTVALVLTDAEGHTWITRTGPDNRATFDALPLGRYALRADADAASEPLIATGPQFVLVTAASPSQKVSVETSVRPIRVFQNANAGGQ